MKQRPSFADLPPVSEGLLWLIFSVGEDEARKLTLAPARSLRDAWIPRLVYDLVWDVTLELDDEELDLVEQIARQEGSCEQAYVTLRRALREHDRKTEDRLAQRLSVFRALCAHIANLERAGVRDAMFAAWGGDRKEAA